MNNPPDTILDRIRRIRAAAQEAQQAETVASAAQGFDAQETFWQRFDEANETILGLILSDDGKAQLDRLEHVLGGAVVSAATLWTQFMTQYRGAEVSRGVMRDRDTTQEDRDDATARFSRACDQMMETLGKMSDQQLLTRIGTTLNGRGF